MQNTDFQEIIGDLMFNVMGTYSTQGQDAGDTSTQGQDETQCYSVRLMMHGYTERDILCHYMLHSHEFHTYIR